MAHTLDHPELDRQFLVILIVRSQEKVGLLLVVLYLQFYIELISSSQCPMLLGIVSLVTRPGHVDGSGS